MERQRLVFTEKCDGRQSNFGAAGTEGDVVYGQVISDTAGGVVAQRKGSACLTRRGDEQKPEGEPGFVDRNGIGFTHGIAVDLKCDIRLDVRTRQGFVDGDDINGKFIKGVFTNRDGIFIKKAKGVSEDGMPAKIDGNTSTIM